MAEKPWRTGREFSIVHDKRLRWFAFSASGTLGSIFSSTRKSSLGGHPAQKSCEVSRSAASSRPAVFGRAEGSETEQCGAQRVRHNLRATRNLASKPTTRSRRSQSRAMWRRRQQPTPSSCRRDRLTTARGLYVQCPGSSLAQHMEVHRNPSRHHHGCIVLPKADWGRHPFGDCHRRPVCHL